MKLLWSEEWGSYENIYYRNACVFFYFVILSNKLLSETVSPNSVCSFSIVKAINLWLTSLNCTQNNYECIIYHVQNVVYICFVKIIFWVFYRMMYEWCYKQIYIYMWLKFEKKKLIVFFFLLLTILVLVHDTDCFMFCSRNSALLKLKLFKKSLILCRIFLKYIWKKRDICKSCNVSSKDLSLS